MKLKDYIQTVMMNSPVKTWIEFDLTLDARGYVVDSGANHIHFGLYNPKPKSVEGDKNEQA